MVDEVTKSLTAASQSGALVDEDRALMSALLAVARSMDDALAGGASAQVAALSSRMLYLLRELGLTPRSRGPKVEAGPLEAFIARMQQTESSAE